jgi:two-component system response regulator CpxR
VHVDPDNRSGGARDRKIQVAARMRPRKTILCVDDNEQALSVRKFMLETRGYRVFTALNAEEALDRFRQGGVDLVLSDLIMPQMDGNELVRQMKEISPDVPTVIISGSVKNYERASRADAFLPKGQCSAQEMLERIRLLLVRKRGPKKQVQPAPQPLASAANAAIASAAAVGF